MFTRIDPPLPMHVLDKGAGQALGVIDYGLEHHLIWVVALDDGGEVWCAPNPKVRMQANWTAGRNRDLGASTPTAPAPLRQVVRD